MKIEEIELKKEFAMFEKLPRAVEQKYFRLEQ